MAGFLIDTLWKIEYPLEVLLAFLLFFVPAKKRRYSYLAIIGFVVISFVISYFRNVSADNYKLFAIVYYLLMFILIYGCVYLSFNGVNAISSLYLTAFIVSFQHLSYKIVVAISIIVNLNILSSLAYFPLFYGVFILVGAVFYFQIVRRLPEDLYLNNYVPNIIGAVILLASSVFITYFTYDVFFLDFENSKLISFLINASEILIAVLVDLYLYASAISSQRKLENETLRLISEKDKERYELAKITIDEINIKYHDLTHMLKEKDIDEEEKKEIETVLTNYKTIIQTSNRGLNTIVYETQLKCISKGIELNVLIDGDPLKFMKSHHIYSLLSNLFDNAMEGVASLPQEKKRINLKINKFASSVILIISNYTDKEVDLSKGLPLTTKENKNAHGFGMRSITRIVDLYNGTLSLSNDNGVFTVKILIPLN